jgi:hypothetical protein
VAAARSFGKTKTPPPALAVGFDKSRELIRTRPPRGAAAARFQAAGSNSNCDSQRHNNKSFQRVKWFLFQSPSFAFDYWPGVGWAAISEWFWRKSLRRYTSASM